MTQPNPQRYLLNEAMSAEIFRDRIVPKELAHGVPQRQPVVVFVAGQPGAGKTKTTEAVKIELDRRGGAIVVNSDFYKPYHPAYARLLVEDDRNAAAYTSMDGRRWMAAAERYLIEHRVDAIIETTMRDPGDFAEPAAMFRAAGYRTEAVILAVPEPLSRLGIVARYHEQVESLGHGRLTLRGNHDASYVGVLTAANAIDNDRSVDVVTVLRRGNTQLHVNYLDGDGTWHWPASTRHAIEAERWRPWNSDEAKAFTAKVDDLAQKMGPQWHTELADITRLARPILTAQPTDVPKAAAPGQAAWLARQAFPGSIQSGMGNPTQAPRATPSTPPHHPGQDPRRGPSR